MRDYAEKIAFMMDFKGKINWDTRPHRPGEIYYLSSTADKVKLILDWEPRIVLDEGLDKTIKLWKT